MLGVAAATISQGTVRELWELYRKTARWTDLKPRAQSNQSRKHSDGACHEELGQAADSPPHPAASLHVFNNTKGNPLTEAGLLTGWQRAMVAAIKEGQRHFTVHNLHAYYTTQHNEKYGSLPELHTCTAPIARVYDRSKVAKRSSLK